MIRSQICEMLGIRYPIFQGGMAWIADGRLASAVSQAGGLGIVAAGNASAERVREQIHIVKESTDKPFGLNIMLQSPHTEDIACLAAQERVPVVTTGAGNPSKYMQMWKDADIKVIPVVASVALAKLMSRLGASALIAEGGESGGHVGELTTMVLVPLICDATDLPVIAAGGIADGRAVAASFALGACGVQVGTRFLTAYECSVSESYKQKVLKANDLSTMVTGKRLGHPVRSIKTKFTRDYAKAEFSGITDEELAGRAAGAFRIAVQEGDADRGCFLCGQVAARINKEQSAAEIIEEMMSEAEAAMKGVSEWVR